MTKRQKILLTGRVQGIGFRPGIYRLAAKLSLTGLVYNDTKGVTIEVQGDENKLSEFVNALKTKSQLPPLSDIKSLDISEIHIVEGENEFKITQSDSAGSAMAQVTADIAVCSDCLREMRDNKDFRFNYPFINCTNCGPRYSIVKTVPYDRPNTTMSVFQMCEKCSGQYTNVADRRFHAQPVACPKCGPKIWLADNKGKTIESENSKVIAKAAKMLLDGKILAIKGIGGFHLAVNALDERVVLKLRNRKHRDKKPFAMMTDSIEKIKQYAYVDESAEQVLKSPQSPIVILPKKPQSLIAKGVAEGVNSYGFMLCYAPLHYMLFAEGLEVLVMTSGNISDEPLICKNDAALKRLGDIADAFVMHDRDIYRQVDDSIVHLIDNKPVLLRRARGYVPTPIIADIICTKDIFAAGGDLKNTFCFVKQNQLIPSEYIGDMADARVYRHYADSVGHLAQLFEVEPEVVVCDLHPGYLSSQYAKSLKDVELIEVQHHWAHIASVLAEYNLDEKVIGLACDGTGYGTDGAIWGCECLVADLNRFERFGHLKYYSLPGGDAASKEAIRSVLGLLVQAYGTELEIDKFSWLLEGIEPDRQKQSLILEQINKGINTVQTSSLGRVFDAVAAMAGLGGKNAFEAQLPMALEAAITKSTEQSYDFEIERQEDKNEPACINLSAMIRQIVDDVNSGTDVSIISAKFHNALADALLKMAECAREKTGLNKAALSGGVFCNRYLANRLIKNLNNVGFEVLFNSLVPSNDGGISLGQAAIALKKTGGL